METDGATSNPGPLCSSCLTIFIDFPTGVARGAGDSKETIQAFCRVVTVDVSEGESYVYTPQCLGNADYPRFDSFHF